MRIWGVAGAVVLALAGQCGGAAAQGAGFIEGRLSYPSDVFPNDLQVCAENLDEGGTTCTSRSARGRNGLVYRMGVRAGTYHVWASTREMAGYRAYYSDFVLCGMRPACSSHLPIQVEVRPGEVTSNIDPADWYKE